MGKATAQRPHITRRSGEWCCTAATAAGELHAIGSSPESAASALLGLRVLTRTCTREQWHAERRRRGRRTRLERATAPYADFTVRIYHEPMPTGRIGPRLLDGEHRAEVLRRVHERRVARLEAERDQRLLSLIAAEYELPQRAADLACLVTMLRWTKPGESIQDLIHHVAGRMRLARRALQMAA